MADINLIPTQSFISGDTVFTADLNKLGQSNVALTAGTIVAADLAADAVINDKIASGVDASKLTTGTLPADRIGANAITTARVNDAAVTAAKLNGVAKDGSGVDIAVGTAPIFGCRAWVRFDATRDASGTVSTANTNRLIIASGNVTSVLRTSLGNYNVIFTTAMPTANYAAVISARHQLNVTFAVNAETAALAPGQVAVATGRMAGDGTNLAYDPTSVNLSVFA